MGDPDKIRRGVSKKLDAAEAVSEIYAAIGETDSALCLFFCSPDYDVQALAVALRGRFGDTPLLGCTTAGEITPDGYLERSLVAVSLPKRHFTVAQRCIEPLSGFELKQGGVVAAEMVSELRGLLTPPHAVRGDQCFGMLLSDGLAMQEEVLVASLFGSLGDIQLFGGSAGDGTRFQHTHVYFDGAFRTDRAAFVLVHTDLPFRMIKTEHFVASAEKMVVTESDPARRVVTEINGLPAGREYARAVGLDMTKLTPLIFATHPVVVKIGGALYVRSIQQVNADESLTFFCAIDTGIVLTVANGVNMLDNLEEAFDEIRADIGEPQLTLGCDCILRYLECKQHDQVGPMSELLQKNNVIGFATYGEQYNGMHVNQTFTGVALGAVRTG